MNTGQIRTIKPIITIQNNFLILQRFGKSFLDGCLHCPEIGLIVYLSNCHSETVDIQGLAAKEEGHYDRV